MTTEQATSLRSVEGHPFPVLFSPGARARAERVAARCERAHHYLKGVLGFDPTLQVLVLSPEDWAEHAAFPIYGMPHYAEGGRIIVGDAPPDFWHGVTRMLDDVLTPAQRAEAEAVYGTVDGRIDMASFSDLLVVHELGHLFHEQVPFKFPRLWLMELFANFCLHAYIAKREPEQMRLWTMLPERMTALPPERLPHRSLDDFERLYVGVGAENYVWYQFRLVAAIKDIHDAAGADALRRLYRTFAAREEDLTDPQLAALLEEQVHPALAQAMRTWPEAREPAR